MGLLFGRRAPVPEAQAIGERLHDELVAVVRQPAFYVEDGVPDTFAGRFDLLVLLASLVLRHLKDQGADEVAQHLVDTMFARFDVAMRELGVSDIGVPKRMKKLAQAFRGRTAVYHAALVRNDHAALADAVGRNVLDGQGRPEALAQHVLDLDRCWASLDLTAPSRLLPAPSPVAA